MNPARSALLIIGALLLVGGGIAALALKAAAASAAQSDLYADALSGVTDTTNPLAFHTSDGLYGFMWATVVVAAIGAILLIGLLVAVAASPKPVTAEQAHPGEARVG